MLNRVTWTAYLGTAVLSLLLVATISGGCTLSRSGELRQECTSAAECILPNACYVSECSETGQCVFTATDNTSVLEQAPDDCGRWECVLADDGTAEPQRLNEDADRPDDVECVTRYECADGELQEFGVGLGTLCGNMDQGVCQDGACVVSCDEAGDPNCDDGNDCTNDICNLTTNECEYEVLDNVDAPAQVDGDCRVVLCALGAETEIYDDLDIYDDGSECTTDTCNQGQPVNTPLPQGTGCTGVFPSPRCATASAPACSATRTRSASVS